MKCFASSTLLLALAGCMAPAAPELGREFLAHDDHAVQVAVLVVDLDTGETLLSREATRLLRPASTMKLLTTAAMCRRAPDAVLRTTLSTDAIPEGRVTLTGGGDPFLSSADVRSLVAALKERGLERVRGGRIRVMDALAGSARFGEGWMWDDEPASFMPAISAAAVDGGCVTVEVTGTESLPTARLRPVAGDMRLRILPTPGRLQVTRGRYRTPELVTVSGSPEPGETLRRRITVPDPARFTAWVLVDALDQEGLLKTNPIIGVGQTTSPGTGRSRRKPVERVTLARSLADIVMRTNKESDNLGAELLLRELAKRNGAATGSRPEDAGIAAINEDLTRLGLDANSYRICDGSGVSHYTLISAELLVKTLADMHHSGGRSREVFVTSLPVAGRDGTLAKRMQGTPAEGRVRAKTGTLSGVSNLAGYVSSKSGRNLAFAILVQNFVGSAAPWRALQDSFCSQLAEM